MIKKTPLISFLTIDGKPLSSRMLESIEFEFEMTIHSDAKGEKMANPTIVEGSATVVDEQGLLPEEKINNEVG